MKKYRSVGGRLCRHFSTQTTTNYQLDNLIYKLQMERKTAMRAAENKSPHFQKEDTTMTKVEVYVKSMEATAENDAHGYSMINRWGPDYDCSSLVITALEKAGFPVKKYGAGNTATLKKALLACGFSDVTKMVNRKTGEGLQRGDILLNTLLHVAVYQGNGKLVHARSNDGHFQSGDQTGREIVKDQAYFDYPWNYILRYAGNEVAANPGCGDDACDVDLPVEETPAYWPPRQLRKGIKGGDVKVLQAILLARGYNCGDIDGDFGTKTHNMVLAFQGESGLTTDGIVGPATWKALVSM